LRLKGLIWALIGACCFRVALILPIGSGPAAAALWISSACSLILLAALDGDMQLRRPGIGSLFRGCSYAALGGSLLPGVGRLIALGGRGGTSALGTALAGLTFPLLGAMLMEWMAPELRVDGAVLSESVVMARLGALNGIVVGCVRRGRQGAKGSLA
jgi:hypothetical protein